MRMKIKIEVNWNSVYVNSGEGFDLGLFWWRKKSAGTNSAGFAPACGLGDRNRKHPGGKGVSLHLKDLPSAVKTVMSNAWSNVLPFPAYVSFSFYKFALWQGFTWKFIHQKSIKVVSATALTPELLWWEN